MEAYIVDAARSAGGKREGALKDWHPADMAAQVLDVHHLDGRIVVGAIEILPESGKAFYALGIAYDRKGQHDRAAEMYRRSREVGGR